METVLFSGTWEGCYGDQVIVKNENSCHGNQVSVRNNKGCHIMMT